MLLAALALFFGRAAWGDEALLDARRQALEAVQNAKRAPRPAPPPGFAIEDEEGSLLVSVTRVEFPGARPGFPRGRLYLHQRARPAASPRPLILVLPISGDHEQRLARSVCNHFAREKYRCAHLERHLDRGPVEDLFDLLNAPDFPPGSAEQARAALDALERLGVLRPGEKVGLAGMSLGAIDGALVAAQDERVGAAALLLGGADLARIFTRLRGASVAGFERLRDNHRRKYGVGLTEIERLIADIGRQAEPLAYYRDGAPPHLDPERYLLVAMKGDTVIPNENTERLAQAIARDGRRPRYELVDVPFVPDEYKHLAALLVLGHLKMRMSEHFARFL